MKPRENLLKHITVDWILTDVCLQKLFDVVFYHSKILFLLFLLQIEVLLKLQPCSDDLYRGKRSREDKQLNHRTLVLGRPKPSLFAENDGDLEIVDIGEDSDGNIFKKQRKGRASAPTTPRARRSGTERDPLLLHNLFLTVE